MAVARIARFAAVALLACGTTATGTSGVNVFISYNGSSQLHEICKAQEKPNDADFCSGFMLSSFDQLSISRIVCARLGSTPSQIVEVGKKYLSEHPELWDRPPAFLLKAAFVAAFPCP